MKTVVGLPFKYPTVVVPGPRQGYLPHDESPSKAQGGQRAAQGSRRRVISYDHPVRAISTVGLRPSLSYKGWEGPSSSVTPQRTIHPTHQKP